MRFQWSVSLPSRGAFHRSLAVLCAIGRHRYLALEGGPPRFPRATSFPVVLAHPDEGAHAFDYGALTPCGRPFQVLRLAPRVSLAPPAAGASGPHNPPGATPAGLARRGFGLLPVRSPLLGECSLLLGVLRCFSSPTYLHTPYVFSRRWQCMTPAAFPHSGIAGALPACGPPSLFPARHALLRPASPL